MCPCTSWHGRAHILQREDGKLLPRVHPDDPVSEIYHAEDPATGRLTAALLRPDRKHVHVLDTKNITLAKYLSGFINSKGVWFGFLEPEVF